MPVLRIAVAALVLVAAAGCNSGGGDEGAPCNTYVNGCGCAPFNLGDGTEACVPEDHGDQAFCCEYDYGDGSGRDDGAYGVECACVRPVCLQSGTSPVCGCDQALYSFDVSDEIVDFCEPLPGEVCCSETILDATHCWCVTGATDCPQGTTEVAVCDDTMIEGCSEGGVPVDTCE